MKCMLGSVSRVLYACMYFVFVCVHVCRISIHLFAASPCGLMRAAVCDLFRVDRGALISSSTFGKLCSEPSGDLPGPPSPTKPTS